MPTPVSINENPLFWPKVAASLLETPNFLFVEANDCARNVINHLLLLQGCGCELCILLLLWVRIGDYG